MGDLADREAVLSVWVVYWNTSDSPGQFTVRRHDVFSDGSHGPFHQASHSGKWLGIAGARALLPRDRGLVCIGRLAEDDPVIVEVWL